MSRGSHQAQGGEGMAEVALGPGCKTQVSQKQNSSRITVVFVPMSGRDRPSPVSLMSKSKKYQLFPAT